MTDQDRPPSGPWIVACTATLMLSIAGLVVAVQQFVVKYQIDNWAHTRTLAGVLFMLQGVLGVFLPVLVFRKRKTFASLSSSRQWLAAFVIPLIYVSLFALLVETSLRSTTMILPRAETPTAIVGFEYGKLHVEFATRKGRTGSFNHIETVDGVEYKTGHSPRRDYSTHVEIHGQAQRQVDGSIQIDLDVDADEPIRLAVEGLERVRMTRGNDPIDETDSMSGPFRVTIVGQQSSNGGRQ